MTTPAAHAHPQFVLSGPVVGTAAAVVASLLTAIGQFKGSTFGDEVGAWMVVVAAIVVATVVVFAVVVPRTLRHSDAGTVSRNALIIAVVGFLSLVVFWLGLPTVLAAGSAFLAADAHQHATGRQRRLTIASLSLAAVTVLLAVLLAFLG
jgi:hypothetical protein